MFHDHYITKDPYGIDRAVKPWNSGDAEPSGQHKPLTSSDSPEQIERCETCPFEDCTRGTTKGSAGTGWASSRLP